MKKILSLIMTFLIIFSSINLSYGQAKGISEVSRQIESKSIKIGETTKATYNLKFEDINPSQDSSIKKEVLILIDTSGSMKEAIDRNSSRTKLDISKDVISNFIDKVSSDKNISVGIATFDYYSKRMHPISNVNSSKEILKNKIYRIQANGTTNIGDAIRVGTQMLKENKQSDKTIIMLTDGDPTGFCWNDRGYYFGDFIPEENSNSSSKYYYNTSNDRNRGMTYADLVINNNMDKNSINSFRVVGLNQGNSEKRAMSEVMDILKKKLGKNSNDEERAIYYYANNQTELNNLYNSFAVELKESFEKEVQFEEIYDSEKLEVVSLPEGFSVQNNKIIGSFKVNYKLNSNNNYVPENQSFDIQFRAKKDGVAPLGLNGTSFVKFLDETDKTIISQDDIYIGVDMSPVFEMKIKDQRGIQSQYQNIPLKENQFKTNSPSVVLKKEPKVEFMLKSKEINKLEYQFIKSSTKPTQNINLISNGWKDFPLEQNQYNNDIDLKNQGKLSHRGYDVNHMPGTDSGYSVEKANEYWKKAEYTFKNPWGAITYKDATVANTPESYGKKESYIEDGVMKQRWIKNQLFLNKMRIGEYKEAAKIWGYIKPDKTGYYNFGTISDDGIKVNITVDKNIKTASDFMTLHGSTFDTKNNRVYLEAGKYYPIHMEYFNWGGEAEFRLVYGYSATNNTVTVTMNSQNVPSSWFYPSYTTTPGEYADAVFSGNGGVDFDVSAGAGDYYIAYKATNTNSNEIKSSGYYGPFTVLGNSTVKVERTIDQDISNLIVGQTFDMTYKIDFELPSNEYLNGLTSVKIKEIKLNDFVPENLRFVSEEQLSEKVIINLNDLVLTKSGGVFKGSIEKTVKLKPVSSGEYIVGRDGYSYISYLDADNETRGYVNVPKSKLIVKENTLIEVKSHKAIKFESSDKVSIKENPRILALTSTNVGVILDIKENDFDKNDLNNQLSLEINSGGKISTTVPIYMYPYDNGTIDLSKKVNIEVGQNGKLKMNGNLEKREYILIYQLELTPESTKLSEINTVIYGTERVIPKELKLPLKIDIVNNLPKID